MITEVRLATLSDPVDTCPSVDSIGKEKLVICTDALHVVSISNMPRGSLANICTSIFQLLQQQESASAGTETLAETEHPSDIVPNNTAKIHLDPGMPVMTTMGPGVFWRHAEDGLCEVEMDWTHLVRFREEDVRPMEG